MDEIICSCGGHFLPIDSIGSNYGLCQLCWEDFCASLWWRELAGYTTRS